MSWSRWIVPPLAGAGFAVVELLLAPAGRPAIGVGPGVVIAGIVGLAGLHLAIAAAARRLGAHAVVVPVVLWAMVWGPEQARDRSLPGMVGWAAPVVLASVGARAPALAATLALVGAVPVSVAPSAKPPCTACPDLLLVTVDTVRADAGLPEAAGAAGWSGGTAVAAAPWTPPSMQSLFLGAPVPEHGAGVEGPGGIPGRPADRGGLAVDLQARGYATAAFVSNPHLRAEAGFARGFDVWAHAGDAPAPLLLLRTGRLALRRWFGWHVRSPDTDRALVAAARSWLASTPPGGRFVWLHLMGPHAWPRQAGDGSTPRTDAPAARRGRYADHVVAVGRALAPLWRELPSSATLVLTSDHGELLGEDGVWGHGRSLAPLLLEVPIRVRSPSLQLPRAPVRLTGLRAALLDAADGRAHEVATAEEAVVAGVRGAPEQAGVWRSGRVVHTPARIAPMPPVAPLDGVDRAALEALGYLDAPEGGTE